jgi:hypothetical protein
MWNGRFQCSELQRRLNIILSILSEGSGRTHLGLRCSPRLRLCLRLCPFGGCFLTRFLFFLFLHTFYVTSSHVFRRSWWHIFESFPFGGDFSFEGVHGCVKIDYLSRVDQSVCAVCFRVVLQTPSQCPTQTPLRGAPETESHNLGEVSNSCFCPANLFFRPLGLMVHGYVTSLQFASSLTTLPYSPLPLHQSDKALVGQAFFWKI